VSRVRFEPPLDRGRYPFSEAVRVRFAETDAMGVVHHAAYLPYLEVARVSYLRSIGRPYSVLRTEGLEFPVIEVSVRYRKPLVFDEEVDVAVVLAAARGAAFELGYLLSVDGEPRATGVTVHAVVDHQGHLQRVPAWLFRLAPQHRAAAGASGEPPKSAPT